MHYNKLKLLSIAGFAIVVSVGLLCATGCVTDSSLGPNTVRNRAVFDLRCPAEQLRIQTLSSNIYGVEGCGMHQTYACRCSFGVGAKCTEMTCIREAP